MARVAMKQRITIERSVTDEWGEEVLGDSIEYKARVDESSTLVRNRQGDEVVSAAQILLDKLADVQYDDYVTYTDELGRTIREKPIKIAPIRDIAGKATLTEVHL